MEDSEKEDIAEVRAESKMNEFRVQALLNLLAKEGVVSKDDFNKELESLCEDNQ
jgi:hypothetical protein